MCINIDARTAGWSSFRSFHAETVHAGFHFFDTRHLFHNSTQKGSERGRPTPTMGAPSAVVALYRNGIR